MREHGLPAAPARGREARRPRGPASAGPARGGEKRGPRARAGRRDGLVHAQGGARRPRGQRAGRRNGIGGSSARRREAETAASQHEHQAAEALHGGYTTTRTRRWLDASMNVGGVIASCTSTASPDTARDGIGNERSRRRSSMVRTSSGRPWSPRGQLRTAILLDCAR
ncbi:hypothetical protein OsJ_10991 [Oryza sativa Japonica Group]|uniref:Uncharacterized protein n=1 Tax=Oryza sativa subsp. japonica TaxID=39947 RepID=B9F8L8_ORYSJ|nr:hypothetical protein OsJ_10991 [Oryza sativa Japonica Group]